MEGWFSQVEREGGRKKWREGEMEKRKEVREEGRKKGLSIREEPLF